MPRLTLSPQQAVAAAVIIDAHRDWLLVSNPRYPRRVAIEPFGVTFGDQPDRFNVIILDGGIRAYEEVV
jgi:hypothetical protein